MNEQPDIEDACAGYFGFLHSCRVNATEFRLTPEAETSAFARCFAIFGYQLLGKKDALADDREALCRALRDAIRTARIAATDITSKEYRQLLAFSLSALSVLDGLTEDPLADLIEEQIPDDIEAALIGKGALRGVAQSGNQAMFMAVFLCHAMLFLGRDTTQELKKWVELHDAAMNSRGFWREGVNATHLDFQNGYHQYEVYEYLGLKPKHLPAAKKTVAGLADHFGHFAPYVGGGGCYDYDAVHVLTFEGPYDRQLLLRTRETILAEQQPNGGFCENLYVRPRRKSWLPSMIRALAALPNKDLFIERARLTAALQRPRHDRIRTHWSVYDRRWDEANLWDTWFRMLAIARIDHALGLFDNTQWGFIDFPGIGYHHSLPSRIFLPA